MIINHNMTQARFDLDDYTVKVLDVVKGRHGLKNRNEALLHFVHEHGTDYADFPLGPETVRRIQRILEEHKKKHPHRTMSIKDVDKLLGMNDV